MQDAAAHVANCQLLLWKRCLVKKLVTHGLWPPRVPDLNS